MGIQYDDQRRSENANTSPDGARTEEQKYNSELLFAIQFCPRVVDKFMSVQKWRIALAALLIIAGIAGFILLSDYKELQEEYNTLSDVYDTVYEDYDFYRTYAVMVSEHGSYYHRHGCEKFKANSFWMYNIDAAESMGYKKCKYCWG